MLFHPIIKRPLTDSSGVAEFQLRYDGQTGAGVLTATYDGPVGSVSIDSNVTAIIDPVTTGLYRRCIKLY